MLLCIVGQVAPGPVGQASRAGGELIQRGQDVAENDEGHTRLGERVNALELEVARATGVNTTMSPSSASESTMMRFERGLRRTAEEVSLHARRRLISRFASALDDVRSLTIRNQRVDGDAIDLTLVTSLNTRREVQEMSVDVRELKKAINELEAVLTMTRAGNQDSPTTNVRVEQDVGATV